MEPDSNLLAWLNMCIHDENLLIEYDRLNGTDLAMRGNPLSVKIDEVTGKFEDDAKKFLEFCVEMFLRIS